MRTVVIILGSIVVVQVVFVMAWSAVFGRRLIPVKFEGGPLDGEEMHVQKRYEGRLPLRYSSLMPLGDIDAELGVTDETFDKVLFHHYVGPYFDPRTDEWAYIFDEEEVR